MQTEKLESTGQLVLTCFLLPQVHIIPQEIKQPDTPSVVSPKRHICFTEAGLNKDPPARLMRAPTPYPKELQRFQRSLNNQLRKNREIASQSININLDPNVSQIKEAKVTPMKNEMTDATDSGPVYISGPLKLNRNGDNHDIHLYEGDQFCGKSQTESMSQYSLDTSYKVASEDMSDSGKYSVEIQEKPLQPPPYHIAAVYSKNAKFFNKMEDFESSQLEKPKMQQQRLMTGLHPKHPEADQAFVKELNDRLMKTPDEHGGNMDQLGNHVDSLRERPDGGYKNYEFGNNNREQNHMRLNDEGASPKLLRVILTPCCYVLGFSIIYNEHVSIKINYLSFTFI